MFTENNTMRNQFVWMEIGLGNTLDLGRLWKIGAKLRTVILQD